MREEALGHADCRVVQASCWRAELIEPRERGIEVCLVEHLAAAEGIAVNHQ